MGDNTLKQTRGAYEWSMKLKLRPLFSLEKRVIGQLVFVVLCEADDENFAKLLLMKSCAYSFLIAKNNGSFTLTHGQRIRHCVLRLGTTPLPYPCTERDGDHG